MREITYTHKFINGKCCKCGISEGKEKMGLCPVIGKEEVANFRDYDER